MYAGINPEADAGERPDRYVDQVQQSPAAARLTEMRHRMRRMNPWVIDALLATFFVVLCVAAHLTVSDSGTHYHDTSAWSLFLTLGATVPYYFRRHAPLAVLLVSAVFVVLLTVGDYQTGAAPTVLLVGTYTVAAYCNRRQRLNGAAGIAVGLGIVAVWGPLDGASLVFNYVLFAAAYFLGATVRNRRLYTQQLEARAAELERERDERAKRAVSEERLRIAQDLHDVVAHSMGVIAVQAGVGAHVIDKDPAEAKKSLEAISLTSRTTLAEIRRMLGVLRDDARAEYAPAPGLGDLERLVQQICDAGVDTHVTWQGTRADVPHGVDLTAYRIVQESLTNVLKHGGPDVHVDVTVRYEPEALAVEVVDDGRGVNGRANGGGHGLLGMRERVGVYGGSFEAGPSTRGGFRVAVRLPYGADA
jgi:signal transduction histidine kinase